MKKIYTILFLWITIQSQCQTFEGTVKWSMKAEITDPKLKAQMEQGQQRLNDPANQAKMKEMQDKMNDPQMKAMMDANPQMKAQIESAMKMAQGGGDMSSILPNGFLFRVKGGNTLTIMEGGMMPTEILHLKEQNKTVRLDRKNKTYTLMQEGSPSKQGQMPKVVVTKTNETMKILNYNCIKYIAAVVENGKTVNQIYWTTTDIKDFDMKNLTKQKMGKGGQPLFYEGIDGVPLKIIMSTPEANMTMEVLEVKKETLSAADFTVPSDYREVKGIFGN